MRVRVPAACIFSISDVCDAARVISNMNDTAAAEDMVLRVGQLDPHSLATPQLMEALTILDSHCEMQFADGKGLRKRGRLPHSGVSRIDLLGTEPVGSKKPGRWSVDFEGNSDEATLTAARDMVTRELQALMRSRLGLGEDSDHKLHPIAGIASEYGCGEQVYNLSQLTFHCICHYWRAIPQSSFAQFSGHGLAIASTRHLIMAIKNVQLTVY